MALYHRTCHSEKPKTFFLSVKKLVAIFLPFPLWEMAKVKDFWMDTFSRGSESLEG